MAVFDSSFDIVIIGGGTAGLTLAARLSENASVTVAVLEAGEDRTADARVSTPGMWARTMKSEVDWDFRTTKQSALGGRELDCPAGRALGGTSSINNFLVSPTSKSHVTAWAQLGNPGWEWAAFSAAVGKAFRLLDGQQGPGGVQLKAPDLHEPDNAWMGVWARTIGALGFPEDNDSFGGVVSGAVIAPETIDPATGRRCSSANAFLEPVRRQRANLTVVTGATVERVLFGELRTGGEDAVAEGVAYTIVQQDGSSKKVHVKARKEVILAAGALSSPRLLELSGVGSAARLRELGIRVVVDNPHVGENLQNHILAGVNFVVREDSDLPSRDPLNRQEPEVVQAAMDAYGKGQGPLATCGSNAYAHLPFPDVQSSAGRAAVASLIHDAAQEHEENPPPAHKADITTAAFAAAHAAFVHSVLSSPTDAPIVHLAANTFIPRYTGQANPPGLRPAGRHFCISSILAHPLSRGSVHATDLDGGAAIDPRFLSHPLDAAVLGRSLRYIEEDIAQAEPLRGHLKPQKVQFKDVEVTREYLRQTARGGHHWVGSCSMMPREMGGVVDARLRVYGCGNLRVCDASVVPIVSRGNTMALVYGVAELGAEIVKRDI